MGYPVGNNGSSRYLMIAILILDMKHLGCALGAAADC
jgi:hypothetical protein